MWPMSSTSAMVASSPPGRKGCRLCVAPPREHPAGVAEDLFLRSGADDRGLDRALRLHVPALPEPLALDRLMEPVRVPPLDRREEGPEVDLDRGGSDAREASLVAVAVADAAAVELPRGYVGDPAADRDVRLDPVPGPEAHVLAVGAVRDDVEVRVPLLLRV